MAQPKMVTLLHISAPFDAYLDAVRTAGLPRRVAALAERAQERLDGGQNGSENGDGEATALDEASLRSLLSLLKQQQTSLGALEVRWRHIKKCSGLHTDTCRTSVRGGRWTSACCILHVLWLWLTYAAS